MSPKHLMFVALACLFYCASKIEITDEAATDPTEDLTLTNEELMASFKMQAHAEGQRMLSSRSLSNAKADHAQFKFPKKDSKSKNLFRDHKIGKLVKVKSLGLLHKQLKVVDQKSTSNPSATASTQHNSPLKAHHSTLSSMIFKKSVSQSELIESVRNKHCMVRM